MKEKYLKIKQNLPLLFLLVSILQCVNSFGQQQCRPDQLTVKNRALRGSSETFTDRQATIYSGSSTFELWQDRFTNCNSNARMTVRNNQTFSASWSNVFNALARESIRPGNSNTRIGYRYTQRRLDGNSFWGAYGWWRTNNNNNTIVEYYVVEDYNLKSNATYGMDYIRNYKANGNTYELWTDTRTGPTVYTSGNAPFTQVKSIRVPANRANSSGISTGTIDMGTHFTQWAAQGGNLILGTLFEVSLKVEGFGGGNETTNVDCSMNATFSTGAGYSPPPPPVSNGGGSNWSDVADGYYRIIPQHSQGQSLTQEPYQRNNDRLLVYSSGNYSNQRFYVQRQGNGTYKIFDSNWRVLTIHSWNSSNGAQALFYDDLNYTNQRFKFRDTGSNFINISPSYNLNKNLDVYGYATWNNAPIKLWNVTSATNQRFRFVRWNGKSLDVATLTDLPEETSIKVNVSPNPTADEFTITTTGYEGGRVIVYDLQGKIIYQDSISSEDLIVSAEGINLNSGIYIVSVSDKAGDNTTTTKLIIK